MKNDKRKRCFELINVKRVEDSMQIGKVGEISHTKIQKLSKYVL